MCAEVVVVEENCTLVESLTARRGRKRFELLPVVQHSGSLVTCQQRVEEGASRPWHAQNDEGLLRRRRHYLWVALCIPQESVTVTGDSLEEEAGGNPACRCYYRPWLVDSSTEAVHALLEGRECVGAEILLSELLLQATEEIPGIDEEERGEKRQ